MSIVSNLVFKGPYIAGGLIGLMPHGSYAILGIGSVALYASLVPRYVISQVVTGYKKTAICLGSVKFVVGVYEANQCALKDQACYNKSILTVSEGIMDGVSGLLGEFSLERIFDYVEHQALGDNFN